MVFCNKKSKGDKNDKIFVTILILVDGFLQYSDLKMKESHILRHNPYFSRWFSAIMKELGDEGNE